MPTSWNAIYLGTTPLIDPTEGNTSAENASALVGKTFGAANDKLFDEEVTVTTINKGGIGTALDQNNSASNDQMSYDLGSGTVTTTFDAGAQYNGTITYTDGSTWTGTVVLAQDTLGNTFLVPQISAGAAQTALVAQPIQSLTINSVVGSNYSGLGMNRQATDFVACFTGGTRILTPGGERRIDDLRSGDLVITHDRGPQPLRWIGRAVTRGQGNHAPISFASGVLGNDRVLRVSPQHCMYLSSWQAELLFGEAEVLVPAKFFVGCPGVAVAPCADLVYYHLMLDRHDMVLAEGSWAESFFPGDLALEADAEARQEITSLFPNLVRDSRLYGPAARRVLKQSEARLLFAPEAAVAVAA